MCFCVEHVFQNPSSVLLFKENKASTHICRDLYGLQRLTENNQLEMGNMQQRTHLGHQMSDTCDRVSAQFEKQGKNNPQIFQRF